MDFLTQERHSGEEWWDRGFPGTAGYSRNATPMNEQMVWSRGIVGFVCVPGVRVIIVREELEEPRANWGLCP